MGVYLNNAATSWPKPRVVAESMANFILKAGANLARGSSSSRDIKTLDMVTDCRANIASLFGGYCDHDPRYVTFTSNVTEALNLVIKGFLRPGMTVLTSSMEHNAVMRPLRHLERDGVNLVVVQCDEKGYMHEEIFEDKLKKHMPDLVVLNHASNVCGTLQDLKALCRICRDKGVPIVVDAAQTAGHIPISVSENDIAALCFTGHKGLLGPQGIGGVVWMPDFADRVMPLIEGGTGSFSHEEIQPKRLPDKFEAGTPNLPGIAGLQAALLWADNEGRDKLAEKLNELGERLLKGLMHIDEVILYGPMNMAERLPVFALNVKGIDNAKLALQLDERWGIETRPGLHCAPRAHMTLGTFPEGALRVSIGPFNTNDDVDVLLDALSTLVRESRG